MVSLRKTHESREIDLKVPIGDTKRKFAIFIDGEAFHGPNAYFKRNTVEKECDIAKSFSSIGYLSIRYSESEIKNGYALNHFIKRYDEFKIKQPFYYYRNWMTDEEVIKYN